MAYSKSVSKLSSELSTKLSTASENAAFNPLDWIGLGFIAQQQNQTASSTSTAAASPAPRTIDSRREVLYGSAGSSAWSGNDSWAKEKALLERRINELEAKVAELSKK